jgi:hypothetical protein
MASKMKIFARILMLSIWLFGVLMPCVVTLTGDDPAIVISLNEEEQKEAVEKVQAKEDIINDNPSDLFSLMAQSKTWMTGIHKSLGHNDFNLEILLPPPERKS